MVRYTLNTADATVAVRLLHASRDKQIRAEPIAARDDHLAGLLTGGLRSCVAHTGGDSGANIRSGPMDGFPPAGRTRISSSRSRRSPAGVRRRTAQNAM